MKLIKYVYLIIASFLLLNCNNEHPNLNYEIIHEEVTETNNKAQLIEYVVYRDSIYSESLLEKVLLDVYHANKDKKVFSKHEVATVFVVYLYTSIELAENDKGAWIAMLSKYPDDLNPNLRYNDLKVKSLSGLNDDKKSKDEIAYENLKEYLSEKNLELCSFYKKMGDIELFCIREADKKFTDYGFEHSEYAEALLKQEKEKLVQKHNLADSIFSQISVFAIGYCK